MQCENNTALRGYPNMNGNVIVWYHLVHVQHLERQKEDSWLTRAPSR